MRFLMLAELLWCVAPPQAPTPPQAPPVVKPACVCGDGCKCAPGGCPGKCPLTPPGFGPAPAGLEWHRDPRGPGGWGLRQVGGVTAPTPPVVAVTPPTTAPTSPTTAFVRGVPAQNCPGGKCPNPARVTAPTLTGR